ncbi:MAG: hypothetical protein L0177_05875 [Chloroflexi bacterium]|nr:hypothetical protein [Chloroflexota bacterium]
MDEVEAAGWPRMSLYLTPSSLASRALPAFALPQADWRARIEGVLRETGDSETGAALFLGDERAMAVLPPFPIDEDVLAEGFDSAPLRELLGRELIVGVVLLRLGRYAVGVLRGEYLSASKTGARYVKNRHRAGGQSQRRFERSRERLVRELYDKACEVVQDVLSPLDKDLDYVLLGGERNVLRDFVQRCRFLSDRQGKILSRALDVDRPGMDALEGIAFEVWRSRVLDFELA